MTAVVYVGPGTGVHLAPVNGDLWCPHGEAFDVDPDLAEALLEQGTFEAPKQSKSTDREGTSQDGKRT